MDEYIKKKNRLIDEIKQYECAIIMRKQQNITLKTNFPCVIFDDSTTALEINYQSMLEALNQHNTNITLIPVEPGKFLDLPDDCIYEICTYFEKYYQFKDFGLVSKKINVYKYNYYNIRRTFLIYDDAIIDIIQGKTIFKSCINSNFVYESNTINVNRLLTCSDYFDIKKIQKQVKSPIKIIYNNNTYECPNFSDFSITYDLNMLLSNNILMIKHDMNFYHVNKYKTYVRNSTGKPNIYLTIYSLENSMVTRSIKKQYIDKYGMVNIMNMEGNV